MASNYAANLYSNFSRLALICLWICRIEISYGGKAMPVSIECLEDNGILIKGEGLVTGNDLIKANDTLYASTQKIQQISYQLCDFTNVSDVDVSTPDIEITASQDAWASVINPNMLFAVVGSKNVVHVLSGMLEALSYPAEIMYFRTLGEAEQWIRENLKKVK